MGCTKRRIVFKRLKGIFYTNAMKAFAIIQCFEDGFGPLSVTTVPPLYWTCLNSFPKTESHHSCGYSREINTVLVHIAVIVVITVDFTIHTISIRQPSLCLTSNQDNQLCCLVERLSWDIDTLMHWYCMLPLRHVLFTLFNASTFSYFAPQLHATSPFLLFSSLRCFSFHCDVRDGTVPSHHS